ncbi:hypothetical protein ASC89_16080 [Devosia sp. Root413D1]|jgi:hypothetical protein|uniref:DUF1134 domain-containing protein n=1 Tax=Devosia insulae DS-56 TaxID=1116389 RepID=A0A1E5XT86_9HYPH|nr:MULTISPECIES: DUF1134 domain-containing protein [Devosia]KQV03223.1 hypothetical protein ASC68_27660 [Devosia sp. Root105]KQW78303.1 hypothetical protein ASC89_16080 [Devosia sp. Root413D1]OEO31793.1 hypothetical protein VW23_014675 [Devosia insulae DS-56]
MLDRMVYLILAAFVALTAATLVLTPTFSQAQEQGSLSDTFSGDELVDTGHQFFGSVAQGLASLVERAVSQFGLPNAYILGEEAGGAIFAGARYGEGTMYTRNQGEHSLFWQGPTVGLDFGGDGSKVMMLVYNLNSVSDVYGRYPGVDGSAYVIGGLGMTVIKYGDVVMVPIRSGVGARLGVNVGYLKFTQEPTWNPF